MGSEKLVHSTKRDDYMTPKIILDAVRTMGGKGEIVLDPCASDIRENWFALSNMTRRIDGLDRRWTRDGGITFVNPPYGGRKGVIKQWIAKCASEAELGAEIVLLVPASTGAQWFQIIWATAQAALFVEGRLKFISPIGDPLTSATFWSFIGYWGPRRDLFHECFSHLGESANLNPLPGRMIAAQRAFEKAL